MPKIAISYRRADSAAIAGRIFDRLAGHFGEDAVFMDIDNIPFGTDFRTHIHETLQRTDVLVAVIGANWLGIGADGAVRMNNKTDPVRLEIETALQQKKPIIPVLVDGAKMPDSAALPAEFGNFAFLNAAELSSGRDFRPHMERLIAAIDQILAAGSSAAASRRPAAAARAAVAEAKTSAGQPWRVDLLRYFLVPLVLLLVGHYAILINNLNNGYLWLISMLVPFLSGFALFSVSGRSTGPATAFAVALGLVGVSAMTVSESLNFGDPLLPQDRFEWRDNLQFAGAIALSFLAGHALARAVRAMRGRKPGRA